MYKLVIALLAATLGSVAADPMRPDPPLSTSSNSTTLSHEAALTLNSVYILDNQSYAVINGQWLKPQESLGDYRVISIDPDRVVLTSAHGQRILIPPQTGSLLISMSDED